ncbi:MAG: enoyl-CoA hydratase/isomerase family protein [Actinomycetota bacterium]
MGRFVRLEISEGVGLIRLDRPPVNAFDPEMLEDLGEVVDEARRRDEVRAVVIWGGDGVFSAGADVRELASMGTGATARFGLRIEETFRAVAELPKITIAAINGYALGGGCELALTADFRFADCDARLGQPEILLGIIPGAGGTQRLPRLVGVGAAKDLIYTGRLVGAEEALGLGLVDAVHASGEVNEAATSAARAFARGPLLALGAAKAAIDGGLGTDLQSGLAAEQRAFAGLFATRDWKIGARSFLENGPGRAEFVGH